MKVKASSTSKSSSSLTQVKTPTAKLGGSPSSSPSPLMPKKSYKKATSAVDFGTANFGNTGLTGES
jgi:hypothetical protein